MTRGTIRDFLASDHARLDSLLDTSLAGDKIDLAAYGEFRRGLLKHISIEEKILLPAIQKIRGGDPLPIAAKLRLDHGALASLLVPTHTPKIIAALRAILDVHNRIEEESDGGVYVSCDRIADGEAAAILSALRDAPEVPAARHVDSPKVMAAARRSLARAGYDESILD